MMIPGGTQTTKRIQDNLGAARQPAQTSQAQHSQAEQSLAGRLQSRHTPTRSPKSGYGYGFRSRPPAEWHVRPHIVELLVSELFDLACEGNLPRETAARRPKCHIRQISMYLCRVVLSMPYQKIASGLGRDRATVIHGCAVVEDRRDNPAYDAFVDRCERCVRAIFQSVGEENARGAE